MDQIKPLNRAVIYQNNTPMIYEYQEYQDDPSNFGADSEKFYDNSDSSDDLKLMIQNYKDIHGLESTSLKNTQNVNLFVNSSTPCLSTGPVNGNILRSSSKTSVNISSLYDSTHELSLKERFEHFDSLGENNINKEIVIRILEKLEVYESKISELYEIINNEKSENNNINIKLQNLQNQINSIYIKNKKTDFEIDNLNDEIYNIDCQVIENNQYSRRESIIISGIPDNIEQRYLEENVLRILRTIGIKTLSSYEISACHRLAKKKK